MSFTGPMDDDINRPISDTLRHAVGGLLQTMREGMAIFAPNANSYRRLRPGSYAPVRGLWGGDNRTVPLRIPGGSEKAIRIEHRVAGADANPYLVMATVLAGIHHGITNKLKPQTRGGRWLCNRRRDRIADPLAGGTGGVRREQLPR
jgi:glutamine synthetase